jgi:hypothetical protein
MKIRVDIPTSVELNDDQMLEITMTYLQQQYGITSSMWTEDGILMDEVEYHTSHSWTDNEEVRPASKLDKCVLRIIKDLHKKIKG